MSRRVLPLGIVRQRAWGIEIMTESKLEYLTEKLVEQAEYIAESMAIIARELEALNKKGLFVEAVLDNPGHKALRVTNT